ncbi:MAG TPA: Uma2 family endonuclease [Thermoanaerobaculia bacterium]|jgi:Uma2 family endonuclease|nr:Uma2 family endonuclease [Thermoanaerobaculia bacterium]
MARRHAVIFEEDLRIPEDAFTFEGFQRWVDSGEFPDTGRIDYLDGDIEVDMSPEDLYTHSAVKTAISGRLYSLVTEPGLGDVFIGRARLGSRFAGLSVEPDVAVVLESSLDTGKIRLKPASRKQDRYSGLEGAADVVVEIVSDSSVKKDTQRLPPLYASAGVSELWIVDARGEDLCFDIHELRDGQYARIDADAEGWIHSPRLGHAFRLTRQGTQRPGVWRYTLEVSPSL